MSLSASKPALTTSRIADSLLAAVVLTALATSAAAQGCTLVTPLNGTSGVRGAMFDVSAVAGPVTITGFDLNFYGAAPTTGTVEIYLVTGGGPFQPVASTASAWTLAGTAPGVAANPQGTPTPLPIPLSVAIPAGGTQGFYVTCTNATTAQCAESALAVALQGSVFAQDNAVAVRVGVGRFYPFGLSFPSRAFNGRVRYLAAATYEPNGPTASLTIDGVQGSACSPTVLTRCVNRTLTANVASTGVNLPWEAVVGFGPLVTVGTGGIPTPGGQIVNVNLFGPFNFLFGGPSPAPQIFPGNFSAMFSTGSGAGTVSLQSLHVDPAHPDGFALSQATQIDIVPILAVPGPTGDDTNLLVVFSGPPLCGPTSFSFYGATFTQFQLASNGRVLFGAPNNSAAPSATTAMNDAPSIGSWADLDPSGTGGAITVTTPAANLVRIDWTSVRYFNQPTMTTTWGISLDAGSGAITIDGLLTWPPYPNSFGTFNQWIGISAGTLGATDPGQVFFTVGGPNFGPLGMGMIYELGQAGTIAAGVNTVTFVPNTLGNYDWSAF